jgi:hypothetical protein
MFRNPVSHRSYVTSNVFRSTIVPGTTYIMRQCCRMQDTSTPKKSHVRHFRSRGRFCYLVHTTACSPDVGNSSPDASQQNSERVDKNDQAAGDSTFCRIGIGWVRQYSEYCTTTVLGPCMGGSLPVLVISVLE